jgi:cbb3-type cytochrome oxidase subunit 3
MSAPKVIGAVLLSIVLFISLCVFSVALTVKTTALSSSYVISLVEDFPLADVIEEAVEQSDVEQSEQMDIFIGVIENNEEAIKERAIIFVTGVYDYLNSRSDSINLNQLLADSVLNDDFIILLIEDMDLKPLLEEFVETSIEDNDLPAGLSYLDYVDDIAADIEPWAKEQAYIIIPPMMDYILGNSDSFEVTVSAAPLRDAFKNNLKQSFLSSPPQEYSGLSQAELGQAFDTLFAETSGDIDESIILDEELFASDDGTAMTIDTAEFEQILSDTREGIRIFNVSFILLIVFMLLLIGGIVAIYRNVKGAALNLGIIFSVLGAGLMIFYFSSRMMLMNAFEQQEFADMPAFGDWVLRLSTGSLFPLLILFIVFIVIGIALLVLAYIYSRRQNQDTASVYNEKAYYPQDDINKPSI